MDLIDRQALEQKIQLYIQRIRAGTHDDYTDGKEDGATACLEFLYAAPTIDAVSVAQRWIWR